MQFPNCPAIERGRNAQTGRRARRSASPFEACAERNRPDHQIEKPHEIYHRVKFAPSPRNHATRDALTRIARGICLHVVRFGMNHQCGAAITEEGIRIAAQVYVWIGNRGLRRAVRRDRDVLHVTGVMAFRVLQAMLLPLWIKVWACGLEVRRIAFCVLMKMDSMFSGRQILSVQLNGYSLAC